MTEHLLDTTASRRRAACGAENPEILRLSERFDTVAKELRCTKCDEEHVKRKAAALVCRICKAHFKDEGERNMHEVNSHIIAIVSNPGEPLAFVINVQSYYDSGRSKARALAQARDELRQYFYRFEFEIMPSRSMLTRHKEGSALLGEAHVAEYTVVQL